MISVVLPVYNERENIAACLRGLWSALRGEEHEILVCYDIDEDDTLPAIAAMHDAPASVRLVKNTIGRGAANAIRAGFAAARGDVVVTSMADLSDPPEVILAMAQKIRAGADVVAGSRYMRGGSQSGGPWLKRTLSRLAGVSLHWIAGVGTRDATSNFRGYSRRFLDTVTVESRTGFEIALELTVKAHLHGHVVAEVPSSWVDRSAGQSRFRMWKWMPNYLRWYVRAAAAPTLVLAVWVAMTAFAAIYIGRYASPIPFKDDLAAICDALPGAELSFQRLWRLHNEHRVPLPMLVYIGVTRPTLDVRTAMYLQVAILAALSLALILGARRIRGRTSVADALFPLLFLHWANSENLLMGFQLALTMPVALVAIFLVAVAAGPSRLGARACWTMVACLIALPLCGGFGIAQMPPLALWAGLTGWSAWRSGERNRRRNGAILLGALALAGVLIASYFVGYRAPSNDPRSSGAAEVLRIAAQVVSLAFGPPTATPWTLAAAVVLVLVAATAVLLVARVRTDRSERDRASGILACLATPLVIALAIGWGRVGTSENVGLATRYVTLTASLVCAAVFAWHRYGPPRFAGALQLGLCAAAAGLVLPHAEFGKLVGEPRIQAAAAVEADAERGMPVVKLAERHWETIYVNERGCASHLEDLHRAGMPPFRGRRYEANAAMLEFFALATLPRRTHATQQFLARRVDGVPVLLAPPESEMEFAVPAGARRLTGRFGIQPDAVRKGRTDGVRFVVEMNSGSARPRVLFERELDPARRAEDRGFHTLAVELPSDGGAVVLRTTNAPGRNEVDDWSFWTEIAIE